MWRKPVGAGENRTRTSDTEQVYGRGVERSVLDREQLPALGDALHLEFATGSERETGTGDDVVHRARHEHLTRTGVIRDACRDVDREARDVVAATFALA